MKRMTYALFLLIVAFLFIPGGTVQAQNVTMDFENLSVGTALAHIGWSATDVQSVVDLDPLGGTNKVLKNTINNYNAAPVLAFTLPAGKKLSDYATFTFKSYWAQGDVGYKDIIVEAYQTMPTAQFANNAANKIGTWNRAKNGSTAWEDIAVSITNTSSFSGTVYFAVGINCAGTGSVGGTGVQTTWYADNLTLVPAPVDTTLVAKWGFLGGRQGNWSFTPGTAPGSASIGGNASLSVEWGAIRGEFSSPITATTANAIVVTGTIEFVGAGIDTWSGLRYGLFNHTAAGTLTTSPVDSTRWSGSEASCSGYMFSPISGTNRVTDGVSGGLGTEWVRVSGNYISTSSGSGPILLAGLSNQKPARAVADAGVYEFAFSVQPLANGTREVRFYLIKGSAAQSAKSTYYFADKFIDTSTVAPTFNGVVFAAHATGSGPNPNLRGMKLSNVKAITGAPFALPEAPWSAYYVDQWGFIGGAARQGNWHFIPGSVIGNAGIGGDASLSVEWGAIRGGFVEPVTATTQKALVVTGKIEFVGAGIDTWSGLRYGLFQHDSAGTVILDSAKATLPDSTRWSGSELYAHGYMFSPISGSNRVTDGVSGGLGTQWIRVSGSYFSTSNGSGPIYTAGVSPQKPARAVADKGVYEFAFSVQPLANGTKEVRFYLIKGGAAQSTKSTYYFGDTFIDTTSRTPTFNGIVFAAHATGSGPNPDLRGINLTDVKVDLGNPITVPEAPWSAYYVDQWGFIGDRMYGWSFIPGEVTGNAGIGGTAPNKNWAAIRGGFDPVIPTTAKALLLTGKVEFVGGGVQNPNSFRFGVFYSDKAGKVILDSAKATLPDSTRWDGLETYTTGYLFIPPTGTSGLANWSGVSQTGSSGAVVNGAWLHNDYPAASATNMTSNYVLGQDVQTPANAVIGAGIYNFTISVASTARGGNDVRWKLAKTDNSYSITGKLTDGQLPPATLKFNSVNFAVGNNPTTATKLTDVKVDYVDVATLPLVAPQGAATDVEQDAGVIPTEFGLSQNYPNPFNPSTTIRYDIAKPAYVTIRIYDVLGRMVAQLVDGVQSPSGYSVQWNPAGLSSGTYIYRLDARNADGSGNFTSVKKLLYMK